MMKHAANHTAWAIGRQQRNGFHVRRVVWGLVLAREERRDDEEIRAASILIEAHWKRRHRKPLVPLYFKEVDLTLLPEHDL